MKTLMIALVLALASTSAIAGSIEAPGKVIYKMPNNEIVKRDVSLRIPARGQGDVVLVGQNELVADRFFSKEVAGRTVFYVVFSGFPGATEGQKSVFRGTYLRGSNKAIYYGNVYIVDPQEMPDSEKDIHSMISSERNAKFAAGFKFAADIEQ